jgi:hypothetical protein
MGIHGRKGEQRCYNDSDQMLGFGHPFSQALDLGIVVMPIRNHCNIFMSN